MNGIKDLHKSYLGKKIPRRSESYNTQGLCHTEVLSVGNEIWTLQGIRFSGILIRVSVSWI